MGRAVSRLAARGAGSGCLPGEREKGPQGQGDASPASEEPTVTARSSPDAHARVRVPVEALQDYLNGKGLDRRSFAFVSGEREARTALLDALASMA